MKVALGTAQFGLNYGINNKTGKVSSSEAFEILRLALKNKIDLIDTAYAYEDSEGIIGNFLKENNSFKIVSKLPKDCGKNTEEIFHSSLERLSSKKIYGYLVHDFKMFREKPRIWDELKELKKKGLVRKVGFSLYHTDELDYLLGKNIDMDLLQFPYNIFDRRFERYFSSLKEKAVEIHTRSVFLQGLFFLSDEQLDAKNLMLAKDKVGKLRDISKKQSIPLNALCLCFVLSNPLIDKVIIGIDSLTQFRNDLEAEKYLVKTKKIYQLLQELRCDDENIIVPDKWS